MQPPTNSRVLCALAALLLCSTAATAQQAPLTTTALRADLAQLRSHVESGERSYTAASRATALARIGALSTALDTAGSRYFELEVARIIALADNGHSNAAAARRAPRFNRIAVRFGPFAEDFHVLRAPPEFAELLGARLVAVDGTPIAQLRSIARTLVGGTDAWRDRQAPYFLESPEQMHTLGAITRRDSVTYTFALIDGRTAERRMLAEPADPSRLRAGPLRLLYPDRSSAEPADSRALLDTAAAPWALREPTVPFRSREVPELEAFVIELRQTRDSPDRPIATFLREMRTELERRRPRNVVLDMRMNGGGDLNTTRDFMRALPGLVPGRIFVLTSPWTFSAAISSVGYLKQAAPSRVTIVGEMVGDRLEFWAEGRAITLTNSGIMIGMSTERHDYATGCEGFSDCHRPVVRNPIRVRTLAPDIAAPWTIDAYRAGRDPGMEAVATALRSATLP